MYSYVLHQLNNEIDNWTDIRVPYKDHEICSALSEGKGLPDIESVQELRQGMAQFS